MEIRNKKIYYIKQISFGLMAGGLIILLVGLLLLQFGIYIPNLFLIDAAMNLVSFPMQIVGFKEPFWFQIKRKKNE